MLSQLQQPPSAGEWPHLEVIPSTPVAAGLEPLVSLSAGAGRASSRVAGTSARETPNDLSAAPGLGRPPPSWAARRGWAGTGQWLPAKGQGSPPSLASPVFPASPQSGC